MFHTVHGCELRDHRLDEILRCTRARGDTDDRRALEGVDVELLGPVDPEHDRATRIPRHLCERDGVRRVRAADDDHRVGGSRDPGQRGLAVGGSEAEVVARRSPQLRETLARLREQVGPLVVGERRLRQHRDAFRIVDLFEQFVELLLALEQVHRLGCDRECAHGFVVAGVADVEDRVALAGPHLGFVMDLGDERAHRVDDVTPLRACGGDHFGRRPVRGKHQRRARRHIIDVVDEDHALLAEPLDDEAVVDDFVVAVHGRIERAHHPRQRLDRHLDAGTEPARLGQQDRVHVGRTGGIDRHREPPYRAGIQGLGP